MTNYNNNIQLTVPPRWLTKKEAREGKHHSSVLLCCKTKQEKVEVIKKDLLIRVVQKRCAVFSDPQPNSQCNGCQNFEHHSTVCRKKVRCQLCIGELNTRYHVCSTSQSMGTPYSHTVLKCTYCQGPRKGNCPTC